ncbi:hypothetical protein D1816_12415 [Aquimarina sp. AD10]|uniref:hypothetical protein n=1 Tax=Aquimarina sp. AD10 TaxID=1714849 RepID=UPI000E50CEE1|nr:hypothetical protein [Aquimarina sp. AD10]AXT61118.1 hypothetical protein D1816_12415 [Aquimarina sp. AD10]
MKKSLLSFSLLLFSSICFSQTEITGLFSTEAVNIVYGQQQIAQQGSHSTTIQVGRSYLSVNGKLYKLYRYSRKEIEEITKRDPTTQQTQLPISVITEDFYLLGYNKENKNYCLLKGDIDKNDGIIYSAKLIKTYDNNEIITALSKCGNK